TAGGSYNFVGRATDSSTGSGPYSTTQSHTINVAAPTVAITPLTLANGKAGAYYKSTVTATGGTAPYSYAVTSGTLPAGLQLAADSIYGSPTAIGSFDFTITATDNSTGTGAPYSGSRAYTLSVTAPTITMATATLDSVTVNTSVSVTLPAATGGTAPYTYSISAGSLPTGVTLTSGGSLTGVPVVSGDFNFTVRAKDSSTGTGSPFYSAGTDYVLHVRNTIVSITRVSSNPTNSASVDFKVVYASPTSVISNSNFTIPVTGTVSGGSIIDVNFPNGADLTTWVLTVSTGTGVGSLGLNQVEQLSHSGGISNIPYTGEVYTIVPPCTPQGGTAVINGTNTFCSSGAAVINASGYSASTSIYQWQSSSDNFANNVSDLADENDPTELSTTTLTSSTWFRLKVTCPLGGVSFSNAVKVTINFGTPSQMDTILPVCIDAPAFVLTQGEPVGPGGIYSGKGVANGSFTAANAGPGTHTIIYTFTNNMNCVTSASTKVTVNSLPLVSLNAFAAVCQDAASFALNGGTPMSGSYSGPSVSGNNFSASTAGAGTHTITYTYTRPSTGCKSTATNTILVRATPQVTFATINPACVNGGTVALLPLVSPTGGTFSGTGVTGSTFNPAVTGATASTAINYSYSDAFGCAARANQNVTVNAKPTVTLAGFANICQNASQINLSGGAPDGGSYYVDGESAQTFFPASASVGAHSVRYEYTDANGCSNVATDTIRVKATTFLTVPSVVDVCANEEPVEFTGVSPFGGTFSGTGVSAAGFNPANLSEGDYTITYSYTNADNCFSTAEFTVSVHAAPDASVNTTSASLCPGETLLLSTGTESAYQWYKNGDALANDANGNEYLVDSEGSYYVTVTNGYNCSATSDTVTVTSNSNPVPTVDYAGVPTFCINGDITLETQSFASYSWNKNGEPLNGANGRTIDISTTGTYSVTVVDANGCTGTSEGVTVSGSSNVIVSANRSLALCPGDTLTLTGPTAVEYQWFRDGQAVNGATARSFKTTQGGSYTLTAKDAADCEGVSAAVVVTKHISLPSPHIQILGEQEFCQGASNKLSAGEQYTAYQWYLNNAKINGATFSTIVNTKGGNFKVFVTDTNGCKDFSDPVSVVVNPLPNVVLNVPSFNTICTPESLVIAINTGAPSVYQWLKNNADIPGANSNSFAVTTGGLYRVYAQTEKGCAATSKIALVNVLQGVNKPEVFIASINVLMSTATEGNQWYKNGELLAGETAQSLNISTNGTYAVIVTNANGCYNESEELNVTNVTVEEQSANQVTWSSYPNPFNEKITVNVSAGADYHIVDMQGRTVAEGTFSKGNNELNLTHLAKGVYHLKGEAVVIKLIKQ
ncbi:MAG: T9SS type A sorting domain-containing protein, partial [Bacteroidota bacterium]